MLAYDYPLLGLFWTIFVVFIWVAWIMLLFRIFGDIFRSDDMGGLAKALWSIFVLLVPFLGVFLYLIVRGRGMHLRDAAAAAAAEDAFKQYVRDASGGGASAADELAKLADLHGKGVISDDEFARQKAKLLA